MTPEARQTLAETITPARDDTGDVERGSWEGQSVPRETVTDLRIVPATFGEAAAFVGDWHRHHPSVVGHRFSIGLAQGDELVGVAIVGNPVGHWNDGLTLEVNRTCVAGGIPNGNSMLYAAAWRAAKALGWRRLVTYTQEGESGASLRAAGWRVIAERPARHGIGRANRPRRKAADGVARTLWEASS